MVATILSAQCTDERVNLVMPEFIRQFPTIESVAGAAEVEIETVIRSTGFYHNKARSLKRNAAMLLSQFGGNIPRTLAELTQLPGVGRKTGSVVLGAGFGISEGIVVDTHVTRISRLLELTRASTPEKIEGELMKVIPQRNWIEFTHLLIHHGRAVCIARRPQCSHCAVSPLCPSAILDSASSAKRGPDEKAVKLGKLKSGPKRSGQALASKKKSKSRSNA